MSKEQVSTALVERAPWDRCDGESFQAFARFTAYRLLPAGQRALSKVGVNVVLAAKWSKQHNWVARASAWDEWLLVQGDALGIHAQLKARLEHVNLGRKMTQRAIECLPKLKVSTSEALVELAESGVKVQRQALGLDARVAEENEAGVQVLIQNVGSTSVDSIQPARRKTYEEVSGTRLSKNIASKGELEEPNE